MCYEWHVLKKTLLSFFYLHHEQLWYCQKTCQTSFQIVTESSDICNFATAEKNNNPLNGPIVNKKESKDTCTAASFSR